MQVRGNYQQDGYALIEQLLPRDVVNAFLGQFKDHLDSHGATLSIFSQHLTITDRNSIEIYGYRYPPMISLLWGLTPTMSELTGRDLVPTYSLMRFYREGDVCKVHSDRPACEHSLSLTLDYSDGVAWELDIGRNRIEEASPIAADFGGEDFTSVTMEPGDAVLYQGVTRRHGRVRPNPNGWSAHMFLHWVDREGPYREFAFDGRAPANAVNFRF